MTKGRMPISAVIYDVDGTMIDSEPLHVAAWNETLAMYGFRLRDLSKEFQATMAGKKPVAIAEGMVQELELSVAAPDFLETKTKIFRQKSKSSLAAMPGVKESVQHMRDAGFVLAIGTSLDRDFLDIALRRLGLGGVFGVIVTGDQIKRGKPDPETYLTVAKMLGKQPEECLVLEDAQTGVRAAKAAGMTCVAVENPNAVKQDLSEADTTIGSLEQLSEDLVLSLTS